MTTDTIDTRPSMLGVQLEHMGDIGIICSEQTPANVTYTLGQGMKRNEREYVVAWHSGRVSTLSDGIAEPMIRRASHMPRVDAEELPGLLASAREIESRARGEARRAHDEAMAQLDAWNAEFSAKRPAWAKAAIVAEYQEDESDSMSDYFNARTTRRVVLAWSKHTRDLFPEMRKAAALFEPTQDLETAPESAENREKWSMGGGYYLSHGGRYHTGWKVSKKAFYGDTPTVGKAEWRPGFFDAPAPTPTPPPAAVNSDLPRVAMRIEKHVHTKKGFDFWLCIMPERVERAEYDALLERAKQGGGWYSRPWQGTPGGFAFKHEEAAHAFVGGESTAQAPADMPRAQEQTDGQRMAAKLSTLADNLQGAIDRCFADRQTNTPKRMREAQSQRLEGMRLERTRDGLRALAAHHEAGSVPAILQGVTTKARAYELAAARIDSSGGYYDAGHDTGQPYSDTPEARAFWAMATAGKESRAEEIALQRKIEALQFASIPGYFPTPAAIVARMIDAARLPAEPFDMLEPSAGSGAILDGVKAAAPSARLHAVERHCSLREVLTLKGYDLAGDDFETFEPAQCFDRVLMNPPFENMQDAEHVQRAFGMLKEGGRLVSIMSPSAFYRQDKRAEQFRDWFESLGGESVTLPEGSFKESGTGVATVLIVLDK